jgi:predicted metal-dependent hydrolase
VAEARVPSLRSRDKTNHQAQDYEHKIEVRRSPRRHRTVTAYWQDDTLVVLIPARMTRAEEKHWVAEMQRRLLQRSASAPAPVRKSDAELAARCALLSSRYLDGAEPAASVRWVPPMRTRWASCTPADRTIRVSERLRRVPAWVLDYVLVHELAHLQVPGHNAAFWELVRQYPKTERAIGYLEGLSTAAGWGISDEED